MRAFRDTALVLALIFSTLAAQAQNIDISRFLGENWYGLYMTGKKIGYSSSNVSQAEDGTITAIEDASFKLNMGGVRQDMKIYSKRVYGPDGLLQTIESRVDDISGTNTFDAKIVDDHMELISVVGGQRTDRKLAKPSETIKDMLKIVDLFDNGARPGDSVTFKVFEPMYLMEIEGTITVEGMEERMLDGVPTDVYKVKSKLSIMGIESEGYMTADGVTLEDKIAGGVITMRLEPEAIAKDVQYSNDTIISNAALVDRRIPGPRKRESVKLRIRGPITEDNMFNSERQTMEKEADSFAFTGRHASVEGFKTATLPIDDASVAEYMKPTMFVQSDHPTMIAKAKEIIGDETDAYKINELLSSWVYDNMNASFSARLTNSLEVLENLEGDCTEHSMLYIGLARAAGLPSREVAGLIYVDAPEPGFYFHQWAAVWVGKWIEVDATFDQPLADATHIKLAEGDLFGQTKLLPIIGRLSIEVLD